MKMLAQSLTVGLKSRFEMMYYDGSRQRKVSNAQKKRFAEQFLLCADEKTAALRCGLPVEVGKQLVQQRHIQDKIAGLHKTRSYRTEIYADEVLRRWWTLATADARDLVQIRRVACRHCYGLDHRYQFTEDELREARMKHEYNQLLLPEECRRPFDDKGGDGYDGTRDPAKDCTECWGEGTISVYTADSRNLSPAAALLYNGVEVGKDGSLKVQMRDRDAAMNMVAKHLGMIVNRQSVTVFQPEHMTDEQLDLAIKAFDRLLGPADVEGEVVDAEQQEELDGQV